MVHSSNFQGHGIGMYQRFVERRAGQALSDTPVVLIVGPRRAGKTTLVRKMGDAGRAYITLDDQTTLDAAATLEGAFEAALRGEHDPAALPADPRDALRNLTTWSSRCSHSTSSTY